MASQSLHHNWSDQVLNVCKMMVLDTLIYTTCSIMIQGKLDVAHRKNNFGLGLNESHV